jgi:hypothetical protein
MGRPRDLFEGGLLGVVPVGASRAPRAGIVLTNDPSADAVRVYDQASNGKLQSAASYATDGVDGSTFGCSGGRPGDTSGGGPAWQRLPRGLQQEAERQEMQVAGIRRVGARVEMIEVGEPRRLASDEALLEVRAVGVASWDEFVRTGGWDVGGRPPMALGVDDVIGGGILERSTELVRPDGTLITIAMQPTVQPKDGRAIFFVVEPDRARLTDLAHRGRRCRPSGRQDRSGFTAEWGKWRSPHPSKFRMDEFLRSALAMRDDPRTVVTDPHASYVGTELGERTCCRAPTRFSARSATATGWAEPRPGSNTSPMEKR